MEVIKKYILNESNKLNIYGKALMIVIIFISSIIMSKIVQNIFQKFLMAKNKKKTLGKIDNRRMESIVFLIRKFINYVIYFFMIILILDVAGAKASIINSITGMGAIAVGFGTQNLVKDIVSGFFLILGDNYSIGDDVIIDDLEGEVMAIGLRSTAIKDYTGAIHSIQNGQIIKVSNLSKVEQRVFVEITVPIEVDYRKIKNMIKEVSKDICERYKFFTKSPHPYGITKQKSDYYIVTVRAFTKPGMQWDGDLRLREMLIEKMREHDYIYSKNINIEYNLNEEDEELDDRSYRKHMHKLKDEKEERLLKRRRK